MNTQIKEYGRSIALGALMGVMLAVVFAAGFVMRDIIQIPDLAATDATNEYPLLDEVNTYLERYYLRPLPDDTTKQYAAIKGMLESLEDRNTFFIEPPVAQSESDALAGTYGGIGVQLQRSEMGDYLLYPFEDSPAKAAGIMDGDILVAVNGTPIEITSQQDAIDQLLRGEVKDNNGVEITVRRILGDTNEEFTEFIPFGVINVPSVIWRVLTEDQRIGYVLILRFTNRTPDELEIALSDLRAQGIQGLILDLRNNGGGLLQESVEVASKFLEGGVVLYEQRRDSEKEYPVVGEPLMPDVPMVVLVNQWTASAAELVAGALLDRERGILIGQQTYGKGTIQQIFELGDRSSIHVTSAEWFTPNRNKIDGVGLSPTIAMIPDPNGRDVEIGEAIRYLQQTFSD
ncbi:MAG: S41 family peptidase [Anaerolineae bacterium]|nr:S41 family peptidase [Anaerolineae bacterium]